MGKNVTIPKKLMQELLNNMRFERDEERRLNPEVEEITRKLANDNEMVAKIAKQMNDWFNDAYSQDMKQKFQELNDLFSVTEKKYQKMCKISEQSNVAHAKLKYRLKHLEEKNQKMERGLRRQELLIKKLCYLLNITDAGESFKEINKTLKHLIKKENQKKTYISYKKNRKQLPSFYSETDTFDLADNQWEEKKIR